MEKLLVRGGNPLCGEVQISGAKNAVVAIIPAVLLVDGVCRIENVPKIKDVDVIVDILIYLGVTVNRIGENVLEIDARTFKSHIADCENVRMMRASYYLIGALLGRWNKASVRMPGGCNFAVRPIDQHVKGFEALGARVVVNDEIVNATADKLTGAHIYLDIVSVGATINIMLAAVLAQGKTIIENAAKEPHIVDLANFLNFMGAKVKGAGTDTIRIEGVSALHGGTYSIIPDQIEAGTFMAAIAATGGDAIVKNIIPKHMESLSAKLIEMGVGVQEFDDAVRIYKKDKLRGVRVKTMPYPGFPTDLQPQIVTLLATSEGTSVVTEGVWESRFQYVEELKKMGAEIVVVQNQAIIHGVDSLKSAEVSATDLRAGAGLVIAALAADGDTLIKNLQYIDRGYDRLESKLTAMGADIKRIKED